MDHLKTEAERQARWFSNVRPRFVRVAQATEWQDLLRQSAADVCSLPFDWLKEKSDMPNDIIHCTLEAHGFLVVSGVLNARECQEALQLGSDFIEAASQAEETLQTYQTDIITDIPSTETATHSKYFPRCLEGGIIPFYGSGHSSCAWMIRSHPHVKQVFLHLYGTNDLISSLDGLVFWHARVHYESGWFHVDQNPRFKPSQECVQGLMNLLPVTPSVGGNVLSVRSHNDFTHYLDKDAVCGDFYQARLDEVQGDDWMEIDPNDHVILDPKRIVTLLLRPGDLLLWDSRVAHCSYSTGSDDIPQNPAQQRSSTTCTTGSKQGGLVRAATLVSMMPTSRANKRTLQERKQAVNDHRTLTHWANKVTPLGAERPEALQLERQAVDYIRRFQQKSNNQRKILYEWDDLSEEQKQLVVGANGL